ncbi:hypothetical protein CHRYSEO8AT_380069 [Chryseobacterium sp. 8AT]|nr:hypothetical protein CHRYSEO8AT_380069 [Chryseobacterium sp. 8AT]
MGSFFIELSHPKISLHKIDLLWKAKKKSGSLINKIIHL